MTTSGSQAATDIAYMRYALRLASRNLGQTWPNPSVGAVIVQQGKIVGCGWTARGGRPHAEPLALEQAGPLAKEATMYVTLEPCAHTGKTPPCADTIVQAGIRRVVVACTDPDARTNGKGIAQLKKAGLEVTESICRAEAEAFNAGFFSAIQKQRPFVAMKIASTLDGKIATSGGDSKWITGEAARAHGHLLRAQYDALLSGIQTVLADNPLFTCRLPGMQDRSPVRVIMDTQLRLPHTSQLVTTTHETPTWLITAESSLSQRDRCEQLTRSGIRLLTVPVIDGRASLPATLELLAKEGVTRVLVEAGPTLSGALMQARLCDRLYWFHSPKTMGDRGRDALTADWGNVLAAIPKMTRIETLPVGEDMLEVYKV